MIRVREELLVTGSLLLFQFVVLGYPHSQTPALSYASLE